MDFNSSAARQMVIRNEPPPVYARAVNAFGQRALNAIYSWGDIIYNPTGREIPPELIAHEQVHGAQQLLYRHDHEHQEQAIQEWWDLYIDVPEFRATEELIAHRVEYKKYCELHKDRNARARYLHLVSTRLSSDLYGNVFTYPYAKKAILTT